MYYVLGIPLFVWVFLGIATGFYASVMILKGWIKDFNGEDMMPGYVLAFLGFLVTGFLWPITIIFFVFKFIVGKLLREDESNGESTKN